MRTWMKAGLTGLLVVGLCWGGAIWYWSATNRMPDTPDLVVFLIVVPLVLLLAIWLGRKLIAAIGAAPAAAATAAASGTPAAPVAAPVPPAAPLALLAAAVRCAHGATPEELASAMADGTATVELDSELVDNNGFPVMSARSSEVHGATLRDEANAWLAEQGAASVPLSDEQWRALSMATEVAADLASEARMLLPPKGQPPLLHLLPILPTDWGVNERRLAGLWLKQVVTQAGWPAARLSLAAVQPSETRGTTPVAVLGRLAHQATLSGEAVAGLVIAAASHVGSTSVDQWEGNGMLFTAARPQGLIPGEGAAGLLLTDLAHAKSLDGASFATLHLESDARRHNSADEAKKPDARLLGTMLDQLLASSGADVTRIARLVTDTGHRTSRVMELMDLSMSKFSELDADTDILRLGAACGTCAMVPFVAAIALARQQAIELAAPVLCISNEDAYRRSTVLVQPAPAEAPGAAPKPA